MKIYLASDHAGLELKEKIKSYLIENHYEVEDFGAFNFEKEDDYPDYISKAAKAVSDFPKNKAIIFGGSGQGEAMLANKYKNVRAALFYGERIIKSAIDIKGKKSQDPFEIVRLSREHNDANILSIAARMMTFNEAKQAVIIWLKTPFSQDKRHKRRIEKIGLIENKL